VLDIPAHHGKSGLLSSQEQYVVAMIFDFVEAAVSWLVEALVAAVHPTD
jgi:hypothetical protein